MRTIRLVCLFAFAALAAQAQFGSNAHSLAGRPLCNATGVGPGVHDGYTLTWSGSANCWAGAAAGGSGGATATFLLCAGPCATNETSNWGWFASGSVSVSGCVVGVAQYSGSSGAYPTGSGSTTVNIFKNGVTNSIFSAGALALPGGSTSTVTNTSMSASATLAAGDFLVAQVTGVAGTITGQGVTVVCTVH
jgi:hypothetical protein